MPTIEVNVRVSAHLAGTADDPTELQLRLSQAVAAAMPRSALVLAVDGSSLATALEPGSLRVELQPDPADDPDQTSQLSPGELAAIKRKTR